MQFIHALTWAGQFRWTTQMRKKKSLADSAGCRSRRLETGQPHLRHSKRHPILDQQVALPEYGWLLGGREEDKEVPIWCPCYSYAHDLYRDEEAENTVDLS